MVRVRVRVRVRRGLQDALDGAEVRAPEESRGRDLEGGGAQPHGDAVEQANAHGLRRSEGGARPAEVGEGGRASEEAAAQHEARRAAVESDTADEQRARLG